MFKLRGSRRRKTEEVIRKFLKSYAENEKSKNKKDLREWLISELKNELPNKKNEEIEKMAGELISGIKIYFDKKKEVEKYQSLGISNSDYVGDKILEKVANEIKEAETVDKEEIIESMKEAGNVLASYNEAMIYEAASIEEPQLVADALSANSVNNYIDNVNETIAKSNDEILKSLTTKTGEISQNPNLDGFIFEERHAGTFNIDASVKNQNYHAEALKPEVGETYGKNSVDMRIEDSNRIVKKYQAKAYKNANETAKSFYDRQEGYKYKFQSKLVPSDQVGDIENSVDKIYMLRFMEAHIGGIFDGKISGVTDWGIFVELDMGVEILVYLPRFHDFQVDNVVGAIIDHHQKIIFQIGEKKTIKIKKILKEDGKIVGEFIKK